MSDDEAADPRPAGTAGATSTVATDGSRRSERTRTPRRGGFWRELPLLVVIALVLALVIKAFLIQAFYIPSGSMENTLQIDDRVLVNKLVYDFRDIRRGEIVVFDANGSLVDDPDARVIQESSNVLGRALNKVSTTLGFGVPPGEQDYIKRVIGIPGDRVMCCDAEGRVTVQPQGGTPVALDEPYLFEDDAMPFCEGGVDSSECAPGAPGVLVPEGRLFVMGDHRSNSGDSRKRYQQILDGSVTDDGMNGTVSEDLVIGRAFVTVWPLGSWDWLGVPELFDDELSMSAAPYALGGVGVLPLWWARRRRRHT